MEAGRGGWYDGQTDLADRQGGADIDMLLGEICRMGYRVLNDRGETACAGENRSLYIAPEGARIVLRSDGIATGHIDQ